ncbi:MAG: DNRLRE domain-containing protein [candidate division KSB1 bacterium]|nr:DNRLRE domain-containing protein [candidate division KSB1 bacterium]
MLILATGLAFTRFARAQSTPVTVGYRDFGYGDIINHEPTGEKPQSKLWWNDGFWWGCLWNLSTQRYEIHRFDLGSQSWITTGTPIDDRTNSKADALWDGQRLYIASNFYTATSEPTTSSKAGRLYRFSYQITAKTYTLDSGFPVTVNGSKTQTLVLAKDSTGQLWITWVEGGKVKVNRSTSDDRTWGTPFDLPVQGGDVHDNDISSVLAFGGNKIGIMWSNQIDPAIHFAVHLDSDADQVWQAREDAFVDPVLGNVVDGHINVKAACDNSGNIYAATKTALQGNDSPRIMVLKRTSTGVWTSYVFGTKREYHTRPLLLVDNENQKLYVFARSTNGSPGGIIYMKSTPLNNISFPVGMGTPFIASATDLDITDPTSTKQCLNSATGVMVLACDATSRHYLHNYIDLGGGGPTITAFTPSIGAVGTEVTITGSSFANVTSVKFNGTAATSFTVENSTRIRATVPTGATTGKISVTSAKGTASSSSDFTVALVFTYTPQHDAYVRFSSPGQNYASAISLLQRVSDGEIIQTYLKFNVAGLKWPIQAAKLRLYVTNASDDGGAVYAVSNHYAGTTTAWLESGLNWSNAPAMSGAALSTAGAVSVGNWVELDVTSAIAGDGIYSFGLKNNSTDVVYYSAKEGANPPQLIIYTGMNSQPSPVITSFSPASGQAGTEVTITGTQLGGATQVKFNGTSAISFTVDSPTQIRATVPAGATTGKIAVICASGIGQSASNFTVTSSSPQYALVVTVTGSGAVALNPSGGIYNAGTVVTLTANAASGFQFGNWSGALSGSVNPATITMNDNKSVTATFIANSTSGSGGTVTHQETKTGGASGAATVTTSASLSGKSGQLYLAAIATKPKVSVSRVSGLGLNWTLVKAQCAGRNQTGVEVWMAQGTPSGDGPVTAMLASAVENAAIAVSRYDGVAASNPIGNLVSGNTNGANGACSGGLDNTTYSFSLMAATGSFVYGAAAMRNRTHTPGNGYSEHAEMMQGSGGSAASVAVQGRRVDVASTVDVDGTFSGSTDWAVVALEIKPQMNVSIASFLPVRGPVGTEVTITGNAFTNVSEVAFNGVAALSFTVDSATRIRVVVPAGATTGKISVTNASGSAVSAAAFTVTIAMAFSPLHDAYVRFSSPAQNYSSTPALLQKTTDTERLYTFLKFHLTGISGPVVNATLRLYVTDASDDGGMAFSVSNNYRNTAEAWTEAGLNWDNAPSISGAPLSAAASVNLDNWVELDVTAAISGNGTYSFGLKNASSNVVNYSSKEGPQPPVLIIHIDPSTVPPPTIASFAPASGYAGTEVTITGANFEGTTRVAFNGTAATAFTVDSPAHIRAKVPVGATSGPIRIATPAGTTDSGTHFTVIPPPTFVFTPLHDAYVRLSSPDRGYGITPALLQRVTDSETIYTYLKFQVAALSGTVTRATLRLYVTDPSDDGGAVYAVSNHLRGTTTEWTETNLNWNKAPVIDGTPISASGPVSIDTWIEFDVTSAIVGHGTYSFGLKNTSSNVVNYSSKEGGNPPVLVIQTTGNTKAALPMAFSETKTLPEQIKLFPAYPNPFNAQTAIEYALPQPAEVHLLIFNACGQVVRKLVDGSQPPGYKRAIWDGKNDVGVHLSSGAYFYQLEVVGFQSITGKMILQK